MHCRCAPQRRWKSSRPWPASDRSRSGQDLAGWDCWDWPWRSGAAGNAAKGNRVSTLGGPRNWEGRGVEHEQLPAELGKALDAFAGKLSGEKAVSEHTRRAYLGDLHSLLAHAASEGVAGLKDIALGTFRRWLRTQSSAGASRATLARRSATAQIFTAWA